MMVVLHDRYTADRLEVSAIQGSTTVTVKLNNAVFQCSQSEWQKLCAVFNQPANNPTRDTQHE